MITCLSIHLSVWAVYETGAVSSLKVYLVFCGVMMRQGPFPEADTGFRQSQASLIWQELEEDEEGQREASFRSLFRPGLRGRRARTRLEEEEEEGRRGHSHRRRDGISDYCDGERLRYFILGTVAAVLALLFNLIYPLLYWSNWAWFTTYCRCRPSVQRFAL